MDYLKTMRSERHFRKVQGIRFLLNRQVQQLKKDTENIAHHMHLTSSRNNYCMQAK